LFERPGSVHGAQSILSTPSTDRIEVLETEPNGIHQLMALRADGVGAVLGKTLASRAGSASLRRSVVHVRRWRIDGLAQYIFADDHAAMNRRRLVAVGVPSQKGRLSENAGALRGIEPDTGTNAEVVRFADAVQVEQPALREREISGEQGAQERVPLPNHVVG